MSTQAKKSKGSGLWLLVFGLILAYAHGIRLTDLSEIPASQRPWKAVVEGGMGY